MPKIITLGLNDRNLDSQNRGNPLEESVADADSSAFAEKGRAYHGINYRWLLPVALLAILAGCSKGSNPPPTTPTPPDNGGGNPPPTQNNYSARGRFLDGGTDAPYSGSPVMFGGVQGMVESGNWEVKNISSGQGVLVVFPESNNNLERRAKRNARAGANDYGEIYGFPNDMTLLTRFNETGRRSLRSVEGEGPSIANGTIKWAEVDENGNPLPPPTINVDDQTVLPLLSVRGTERQTRYTEVLNRTLREYIPLANSYFQGAQVIRHPTSTTLPADGTSRALIIRANPVQTSSGVGGQLEVYVNKQNNVYSCTFIIYPNVSGTVIVQDSIQCASGLMSDITTNQEAVRSFYNDSKNSPEPEDGMPLADIILGKLQRKMRAGTRSPWDDSHLPALDPVSDENVATSISQANPYTKIPKDYLYRERPKMNFNLATNFFAGLGRR
ncbi:hypothetical protein HY637_01770 [Candidatus Woesearchaeota archaeon]|nr:hypothetical protein [Candidatus Woesearchaeota archaeon]